MRLLALTAASLGSVILSSAHGRADGSCCARYSTGIEGSNAGFYSFEQCQAAISGNGGHCSENLLYGSGRKPSGRSPRH